MLSHVRLVSIAAAGAAISLSSSAFGSLVTTLYSSDAAAEAMIDSISFEAEGRIGALGGPATFELGIGPNTSNHAQTANFPWVSGTFYDFSIIYDGIDTVTFDFDGVELTYQPTGSFTDIFLRTRAVFDDTSIILTDLFLNGDAVGESSQAIGSSNGVEILQIAGGSLSGGFTLQGSAMMEWDGSPPSQSQLAFQMKFATVIPSPASIVLLLCPFAFGSRRRRH